MVVALSQSMASQISSLRSSLSSVNVTLVICITLSMTFSILSCHSSLVILPSPFSSINSKGFFLGSSSCIFWQFSRLRIYQPPSIFSIVCKASYLCIYHPHRIHLILIRYRHHHKSRKFSYICLQICHIYQPSRFFLHFLESILSLHLPSSPLSSSSHISQVFLHILPIFSHLSASINFMHLSSGHLSSQVPFP